MEEETVFFSVVVLAYQVKNYLEECLDSVLAQTFQNFEVILLNPNSSDGTETICQKYKKRNKKIRLLEIENQGQLLNRISGFKMARGKYLLCLDGDDYWAPELLERIYQGIRKNECDWIIFGYKRIQNGKILDGIEHIFPDETVFEGEKKKKVYEKLIAGKPFNTMWEKVMSRSLFERIMREDFSEYNRIRSCEDLLFNCYAATYATQILYLDAPLYRYRKRKGSITHVFRIEELEDYILVKKKIQNFMAEWNMENIVYYSAFYANICDFFSDWIYRCAISEVPFQVKKKLFERLRQEPLFWESLVYRKTVNVHLRHRIFTELFRRGDYGIQLYAEIFLCLKKCARRLR